MPRLSKKFALLLVLAMLASMFVGMGTASAATTNVVTSAPTFNSNAGNQTAGEVWIYENDDQADTVFNAAAGSIYATVTILTSGVTFQAGYNQAAVSEIKTVGAGINALTLVAGNTDKSYTLRIDCADAAGATGVKFKFPVKISGASAGPVKVRIDAPNTGITEGEFVIANIAGAGTTATVLDTDTVQTDSTDQKCGMLRITENVAGATTGTIRLDLPADMYWNKNTEVSAVGFTIGAFTIGESSAGYSRLSIPITAASTPPQVGMITIIPHIDIDEETTGDITVSISGTTSSISSASVVIGTAGDYDVVAEAAGDPTTIYAGTLDAAIADFRIKEVVKGSLQTNRSITVELPAYVHWFTGPYEKLEAGTDMLDVSSDLTSDAARHKKKITVGATPSTEASNTLFERNRVYVDADAPEGDVEVVISGAGIEETKLVLAKVAKPITATGGNNELIIGEAGQAASDLVITEVAKGMFHGNPTIIDNELTGKAAARTLSNRKGYIVIDAPSGVTFAEKPTVTVDGNLKLDEEDIDLINEDNALRIRVKTASTEASKITISDIKLTLDRTVPVGDLSLAITGASIDRVGDGNDDPVVKAVVGKVVTPAPSDKTYVATFVIGEAKYTLDGVEITMDVAPYIKDSRTFMPIRYVANALGISDNNIMWDGVNQTVTLMKNDKVVQVKIGSNILLVNGAAITMDVAPEINNERTCLPIALIANAFGASASWDAATQTVTIQ